MHPVVCFVLLGMAAALAAPIGVALLVGPPGSPPAITAPAPAIRPLPHPRCFPPGTLGAAGFAMCPDSAPTETRA